VIATRARAQASGFAARLRELGADVVQLPVIRIVPPEDPAPLHRAAAESGSFDWIVFTSANGVERFFAALAEGGGDARSLGGVSVCAIGPATAAELAKHGVRADLVPPEFVAESALEALASATELEGKRILIPRAAEARPVLPDGLRARGADVIEVAAYRTISDGSGSEGVRAQLDAGEIDWVTFTAGSTVRSFAELLGADPGKARVASIGPITSAALRERGMRVDVEAEEYTIPGLLQALRRATEEVS
jgi:uroporphyrinogen III methyltransferase/synthase